MRTFPIMLAVKGVRAVVVGGGPVGLRKAKALLAAGAEVTLVDPAAGVGAARTTVPIAGSAPSLRVVRSTYRPSHLRGARLVMACTNDRALNARIAADARRAGALVNAADQPEDCDFYLPAVVRQGDIVVAIGTGGAAPGLAAALRRRLSAALPRRAGAFAAALARLRASLRKSVPNPRRRMAVLKRLAKEDAYRAFVAGGARALRERARKLAPKSLP